MVNEFGRVEPDLRFRTGIVIRVADGPDGGIDDLSIEPVGEGNPSIDRPGVEVMRKPGEPGDALPPVGPESHLETAEHERCGHRGGSAPAEDAAGVRVEHERDVDPSGPCPDVGEGQRPRASWCGTSRSAGRRGQPVWSPADPHRPHASASREPRQRSQALA